jgi:exopolysaccharide biosynthesis polyprenyl glycosylphosphotransferase
MRNNTSAIYNLCLVIGDSLSLIVAFTVAYVLRVSLSHRALSAHVHAHTYIIILITLLPFWVLIFALLGLYNARHYENRFDEFGRLVVASFIGILFAISYAYIANVTIFPARLVSFYDFGLAFLIVFILRTLIRAVRRELFSYGIGINYVLLVGDTRTTHQLIASLADTSVTGYRVIGVVGGSRHPLKSAVTYPVFTNFNAAVDALQDQQLHTIIQTELYAAGEQNNSILSYAQEHHMAYQFVPGNSDLFVGNIKVDLFHSVPVIAVHPTALIGWGRVLKRGFDLFFGVLLLIPALPIMAVLWLLYLFDHGDPIYAQPRLSRYGRTVKIYKFRTLLHAYNRLSPEEAFEKMGHPEYAKRYRDNGDMLENDPRISSIGRYLRKTSLDELPQLLNVIKGDISLVGPRPLVPFELEKYGKKNILLSVKSGLTGLAVISGRSNIPYEERRKLDLYYVQNWSFGSDIVILFRTISVVLFHRGAR